MKWTGLSRAAWVELMFQPAENRAGLSPAVWAGLMFQPKAKKQGRTQPSRVGWANVPAQRKNKKPWLVIVHAQHSNWLFISSCMQNVHSARSASKKMANDWRLWRGREFTWGDDLRWLSWRWCWRLFYFSVALRWWLLRSLMTVAVLLLHNIGTPGHSGSLFLSFFLPFLCLPLSVSLSISPVFDFYCFGSFSLNTVGFTLSVSLPVFCRSFFSSLLFCVWVVFIEAGGVGSTLPHPIATHAWVHVACSATAPTAVANGGVACGTRLL